VLEKAVLLFLSGLYRATVTNNDMRVLQPNYKERVDDWISGYLDIWQWAAAAQPAALAVDKVALFLHGPHENDDDLLLPHHYLATACQVHRSG
jgi:hypothetical protein